MNVHFSSKTDLWATPKKFFDEMNKEFNFDLDVCAIKENAKCDKFFTKEQDGLKQNWSGFNCWMNPPYGREIKHWIKKAFEEAKKENTLIVALIPARTDTRYFHEFIYNKHEIRFIKGRLKFGNAKNSAPFPSMIAIFKK